MNPADLISSGAVEQVIGAFFMIRRSLFSQLNGFDERFFVYYEEVDLSLRSHQLGFASYYLADTVAYHRGGASSSQVLDLRLFYVLRSRLQYAQKHFRAHEVIVLGAVTLFLEPLCRIIWAVLKKQKVMVSKTVRAYWWLLKFLIREVAH